MTDRAREREDFYRARAPREVHQRSARRIYDLLRSSLRSGADGDLLTEPHLLRDLSASRDPTRFALKSMAREGLLTRQTKTGTRLVKGLVCVVDHLPTIAELDLSERVATFGPAIPPAGVSNLLGTGMDQEVLHLDATLLRNESRLGTVKTYAPLSVRWSGPEECISRIEKWLESGEVASTTYVQARAAEISDAEELDVEVGDPLLVCTITLDASDGTCLAVNVAKFCHLEVALSAAARTENSARHSSHRRDQGRIHEPATLIDAGLSRTNSTSTSTAPLSDQLRRRLRFDEHVPVLLIEEVFSSGPIPMGIATTYFAADPGDEVADADALLRQVERWLEEGSVDTLSFVGVTSCDVESARLLGVRVGDPLLWRETIVSEPGGRVRAHCFTRTRESDPWLLVGW